MAHALVSVLPDLVAPALSLLPVALGAVALGRALFESARGAQRLGDGVTATASLSGLAIFLLALQPSNDARDAWIVAAIAVAIWLGVRARREPRWAPLLLVVAGAVSGARPVVAIGLCPFVVMELSRSLRAPAPLRAAARALFVFVVPLVVGHFALGGEAFHPGAWTSWLAGAAHAFGAAGVALACGGILLALVGEAGRRTLALSTVLLLLGEASGGVAGPLTALALALGVGLALLEAATRAATAPRGAALALVPLVLLAIVEPLTVRVEAARWSAWTLGPVPPRELGPARVPARSGEAQRLRTGRQNL